MHMQVMREEGVGTREWSHLGTTGRKWGGEGESLRPGQMGHSGQIQPSNSALTCACALVHRGLHPWPTWL